MGIFNLFLYLVACSKSECHQFVGVYVLYGVFIFGCMFSSRRGHHFVGGHIFMVDMFCPPTKFNVYEVYI